MKLWGTIRKDNRMIRDTTAEFPGRLPTQVDSWDDVIGVLCRELDLSRPVLLKKHVRDILEFSRAVFKPGDFMEDVDFDRFEVEIFIEKKQDR